MLAEKIQQALQTALPEALVIVEDPMQDDTHLEAIVVSKDFEGVSLVKQHQMVMHPLKESFNTVLHALALKTYTPESWEKLQK